MRPETRLFIDPTIPVQYPRVLQGLGQTSVLLAVATVAKLQRVLTIAGFWTGGEAGRWTPELVVALDAYWASLVGTRWTAAELEGASPEELLRASFTEPALQNVQPKFSAAEYTGLAEVYAAEKAVAVETPVETSVETPVTGNGAPPPPRPATRSWLRRNWPWAVGGTAAVAGAIGFFVWRRKKQAEVAGLGGGCGCTPKLSRGSRGSRGGGGR